MRRAAVALWAAVVVTGLATWAAAGAEPGFAFDFEGVASPEACVGLRLEKDVRGELVAPGAGGAGHALLVANREPSLYATVVVAVPTVLERNLVLTFDHREEVEAGREMTYVGVLFTDPDGKQFFGSDTVSADWHQARIPVANLHPTNGGTLASGLHIASVRVYARAKGQDKARMTLWVDNLRLAVASAESRLSDRVRVSTANPPLFNWPPSAGAGRSVKLAYARDPSFPAAASQVVETTANFHTPAEPLEPGRWYWRVYSEGDLAAGWSDAEVVDVLPEAHRFTTPPVPVRAIADLARPRLLRVADGKPEAVAKSAADLRQEAAKIHDQGVPPDPPRYAAGNPEWPTWIEWYGKVHGGITSRTGTRLQRLGEIAMRLPDDAEVRGWTRDMALAAAAWDPKGGSAYDAGDIGAHHLLRGLCWCYDALRDRLAEADRQRLREAIVARALPFDRALNPFRGGEANNHAWLKTLALGEAGLTLIGDHEPAAEWAEYSRQLYLGRFLCALGYQGDNNEGIDYWGYGLSFIIEYGDLLKAVCGIDLFRHPWLSQTARFPLYCAPPGGWAVSFADTGQPNHGVRGPAQTRHVRALALRTRDPYALWYSGAAAPVEGLEPQAPLDLPQSIHYRYIGWAILNTDLADGHDDVTLAMRSGPFYAGHQHDDQNGFVLHAYGEKLAVDSGHYDWYGSEHFKRYSTLTRAHNTILVNGRDQAHMAPGADGRIAAFFDSPGFGLTVGDASDPEVYQGQLARFDRCLLFRKPGLVIVRDRLRSAQGPARYDWLLHTVAAPEIDPDMASFQVRSGAARLQGHLLLPAGVGLAVTKGYPVDPVDRYSTRPVPPEKWVDEWTLTATPATPAVEEQFLAVLDVERVPADGVPAAPARTVRTLAVTGGVGLEARAGDLRQVAVFRAAGATGPLQAEGLETDGEVALVETRRAAGTERDAVCAVFGHAATIVRWQGQVLWASGGAPADVALERAPAGWLATLVLTAPGTLSLPVERPPAAVLVDGHPAAVSLADAGQALRLELGPGAHRVAFGERPAELGSGSLPSLAVEGDVGGRLSGHAMRPPDVRADGDRPRLLWQGALTVPKLDRYELALEPWTDAEAPRWALAGERLAVECSGGVCRAAARWLAPGPVGIEVRGAATPQRLRVRAAKVGTGVADMLPAEFAPVAGCLTFEAEQVAREGAVKGKVAEKVGASGGRGHCNWDTFGQWAEWEFEVAQPLAARLLVRGASETGAVTRAITLDGQPLWPGCEVFGFDATGGWCRTTNDWRYFRLTARTGDRGLVRLAPGRHVLRLEQLGGSMNLDGFAWEPVGAQP